MSNEEIDLKIPNSIGVSGARSWRNIQFYFLIAGCLILILFGTALFTLLTVIDAKDEVISNHSVDLIQIKELEFLLERKVSKNRAYLLTGDESLIEEADEVRERYIYALQSLKNRITDPETAGLLNQVVEAEKLYDEAAHGIEAMRERGVSRADISAHFVAELIPKRNAVGDAIKVVIFNEDQQFKSARKSAKAAAKRGIGRLFTSGLLALIFCGVIFYLLVKTIRLKDLADRGLAREKVKLQRSNEELEQFANIAAHDLRSPVQSIVSWSQILDELVPKPRAENLSQSIDFIQLNSKKAINLIDDLLEIARVNRTVSHLEPVDLEKSVGEIISVLKDEVETSDAHIEVGKMPQVYGNPSHLESLFSNLIRNALTYRNKNRRPEIAIGCKELSDSYEFFVKDNGIGIAADDTNKIFQMFKRLHGFSDYPGTGIGLAFCKKVVELYGGKIWVSSAPGAGSTFFFIYPKEFRRDEELA